MIKSKFQKALLLIVPLVAIGIWVFVQKNAAEARQDEENRNNMSEASRKTDTGSRLPSLNSDDLDGLRATLANLTNAQAVAAIINYLRTGKDQATGESFAISKGGTISGWPSHRIYLLDALLELDPEAAAQMGREILQVPTSSDEWAIAMRNVAVGEADSLPRELLKEKTEELIMNPEWKASPSIGYLNAFDVLVHVDALDSSKMLSELIQGKDRRDLAHAAFLTLDRLVQRNPQEMLARVSSDVELQKIRPEMAAQQMARADLRDPRQREILGKWMLDPSRSATQLRVFTATYPNHNQFVSNNLLTKQGTFSGNDLAIHDREALAIITSWQTDPAYEKIHAHLNLMSTRLRKFVATPQTAPDIIKPGL